MVSKPDVEVFYSDEGNVCFVREDAVEFFRYVNDLETVIEEAQ